MGDLIDRQAAIDALHQYFADGFEEDRWWNSTHVLAALEQLPTAQPEIVLCKDCIFHGFCITSPKWAVAPKDDWYCADAERRTDDLQ